MNPHSTERAITLGCNPVTSTYCQSLDLTLTPSEEWIPTAHEWLSQAVKYDSTSLALWIGPEYLEESKPLVEAIRTHYKGARVNQNTVEAIGERQARNFLNTLQRMANGLAIPVTDLPSMDGQTVVVVGAGASLDGNINLLKGHRGPILAVNTSVGALAANGIKPTLVLSTESKDISEGLSRNTFNAPQVLDATSHPNNWPQDPWTCGYVFCGTEPNLSAYARNLGLLPLGYGPSCVTAATSLALTLGAEKVVLVGCDFSYVVPGRHYASGTPYEDTVVTISGAETLTPTATIEGTHKPCNTQDLCRVVGIQGELVWTSLGMLSFVEWFQDLPANVRARITNCSEQGALLHGIEHKPLSDLIQTGNQYSLPVQTSEETHRAVQTLATLRSMARQGLTMKTPQGTMRWAQNHPLLHLWTSPEILRMRRSPTILTHPQKALRLHETIQRACTEILALLSNTPGKRRASRGRPQDQSPDPTGTRVQSPSRGTIRADPANRWTRVEPPT